MKMDVETILETIAYRINNPTNRAKPKDYKAYVRTRFDITQGVELVELVFVDKDGIEDRL